MNICVMCASPVNKRLEEPNMLHLFISASNIHGTRIRQEGGARSRVIYILKMSDQPLCRSLCLLMLVIALMAAPPLGSAQAHDEPYIVKPTPILRATGADDLTTVLLVNNDGGGRLGDSHGRFLSVRPEIGLLTSTARTFIQEGVTTEYATQVVGTTLNNGRLYAQYLKKSSRVLFENRQMSPSVVTSWVGEGDPQTRSYLQSHNDLLDAEAPDWREIDDRLDHQFVGNTDYIKLGHASQLMEASTASAFASTEPGKTGEVQLVANFGRMDDNALKVAAHKVLPIGDLPTFTVKNHFEPSAYQTSEGEIKSQSVGELFAQTEEEGRSAKVYYQDLMQDGKNENSLSNLQSERAPPNVAKSVPSTVTYYGFAEFTTLVGDSLIVFLPSTAQPSSVVGHVTSIKGMATLRISEVQPQVASQENLLASKTADSKTSSTTINPWAVFVDATETMSTDSSISPTTSELIMSEIGQFSTATPTLDLTANEKVVESSDTKPMFSLPTDQEIQEIYASLAKAEAASSPYPSPSLVSVSVETVKQIHLPSVQPDETLVPSIQPDVSSLQVHGGATTIFIDDDPFANFVEPTSVLTIESTATTATAEIIAKPTAALKEKDTTSYTSTDESEEEVSTTTISEAEENSTQNSTTLRSQLPEDTTDPAPPSPSPIPIIREISGPDEGQCAQINSQVFLTQIPKSNTILNTQVVQYQEHIPFDIKETTKYYCIEATQAIESPQLERPTQTSLVPDASTSLPAITVPSVQEETTTVETQTEVVEESSTEAEIEPETESAEAVIDDDYVTESDNTHLIDNDNDNEDYDNDSGSDEVDLIYKTLYTTYTYLTTFFQGPSTTISSHTEIVTNVVSSTRDDDKHLSTKSTDIVDNEISATRTQNVDAQNTAMAKTIPSKYMIPDELESLLYVSANDQPSSTDSNQQTSYLDDTKYTKTFFTTYTYYTTIFAESETEIMSRTEVFTNYITELGAPKKSTPNDILPSLTWPAISLSVSETTFSTANPVSEQLNLNNDEGDGEKHVTLVTDVRSSSSNGEQQVIGGKIGADDQVSSESNTEEILPSATLLLQTSFTTFTFYTTMYVSDSTNVVSRLETVTNIATETLQPTKVLSHEETTLPITYFTTFTYWTKLAKDGEITTISREETISNVIEPSNRVALGSDYSSNSISDSSSMLSTILQTSVGSNNAISTSETNVSELTTFYTTYTYYTTSYEANKTVTDSRFETITNVITPKSDPIATSAVDIEPSIPKSIASSASETTETQDSKKNDLIFYDYKHIIDAEGVSTLYFTTQIQSTVDAEGKAIEVTSSTSSLSIDEEKKINLATALASEGTTDESSASARQYKTGLVRLIEGTRIGNSTTTLYQSKVIGTIIDSRYAQIIESTSSFIFEKAITAASVVPSATVEEMMISSTQSVSLLQSVAPVEGSIAGEGVTEDPNQEEEHDNARLAFQSKKRTFAPVIRPFASRNRPTFAPRHKTLSPSSATIITRSDITPTITATPALKSVGRYSSSRRGAISNVPNNPLDNGLASSTSSRRLFGRPIKPSTGSGVSQSTGSTQQASLGFASRNRFASSSRAAPISSSRRLSINASYRPSSSSNFRASALNVANSKQRIKPTSLNGQSIASTLAPKQASSDGIDADEESSTEEQTQANEEDEKAAQNSRRSQNPLLRFRRPLNRPSGFTPTPRPNASPAPISPRRNPLSGRAKSTTTTTTTTTTTARPRPRSFQRPTISSLQARARPQSNLFPPRGLFQQQREPVPADNSETNDADNESEYDDDEDGEQADGDGDDVENEARRRRSSKANPTIRSRKRRQADTLNRSRFRFRRPKTVTTEEPIPEELPETSPSTARAKINSRFGSRYQAKQSSTNTPPTTSHRSIRPTRPTSPRTQFTLREKDTTSKSISRPGGSSSNFRRQQQPAIRRNPTVSSSASSNSRRLKNYSNHNNNNNLESSGLRASSNSRSRNANANAVTRGRGTMRGRNRNEYSLETPPPELGSVTITVTHLIPAEVTVPVVNGQVTEYKNIVTAKTSIEVLGPHQYTQSLGNNGQTSLFLTREDSSVNAAGATELTRYLLQDSLTSTVTFTPTTIRGRKTSFSHVLPSTVYSVENVISTLQPQIAANAPLANILLSQLLLGNINLPSNPLLGALGQPQALGLGTGTGSAVVEPTFPVTEYRTHTSTYVTTIYDGKSTIVPITFQGKKILTTVFDTTAQTITATEYSVDTIINTPSPQTQQQQLQPSGQVAQVNSLLLQQLLLQQQQQQQQLQIQLPAQIMQTTSPQILLSENLQDLEEGTGLDANDNIDDIIKPAIGHDDHHVHSGKNRKKTRKSNKGHKRNKQQLPRGVSGEEEESSVVTLYVSGRRPGEFSTILSTVLNSHDHLAPSSLHKRHAQTAVLHIPEDEYEFGESERVLSYLRPQEQLAKNLINSDLDEDCEDCAWRDHTASLESIIGDVDLWYAKATKQAQPPSSSTKETLSSSKKSINQSIYFLE
ncbi:serine-rich adhesin for platelets isoform X1 [Drosophila virilis]|uniref:Uncharacterized protein, isoform A n=1 Tax=Drosophila virilis TaxID=7244 RepID=B4MF23_DROVI|nr:uncharacterized protein LOC6636257 [Drosophila virilis]XP_015024106.1 uncharacterized protein LOC6636257 [Drosophila virilis]XP_032290066.1 uncharacterized protein LOC6636257 [Drosophila virilis]XP_032290067.1 uncharacterized protein LOC6636257 [Drosophila virilis]EDW71124.2 uncharacterized protein Dvir_GJ19404, isoform A [Drosophila virilis]KRF85379.1 uncharacterized protein Dvir_GJ19404, isoform B [Drosophila virilis]